MTGRAKRVSTTLRGRQLLNDPVLNKGTAFTAEERLALGVEGLLPTAIETLKTQIARRRQSYDRLHNDLERHIFLQQLRDDSEVLFYAFVERYLVDTLPIVYTPTVGAACQEFSHIYQRPIGVFISRNEQPRMAQQFDAVPDEIDVIVVTDGERILGLGDQGIGGMGIPIGKLALYTAVAGIDPQRTLPVILDVGTNNQDLLDDPLYMGHRGPRITGDEYLSFVDDFVATVSERFPGVLLQWEDFAGTNAAPLLDRHRDQILSFNDDIQGTAAVALAAIVSAVDTAGRNLADERVLIVGAGSAGTGIADMLAGALAERADDQAHRADHTEALFLTDRHGLLHDGRRGLTEFQAPFAQPQDRVSAEALTSLDQLVTEIRPTILIGVTGQGGLFTESMVRTMADVESGGVDRPIIMPMSNPTSKAEAIPADLLMWTDGRAIVATGSPFEPVAWSDKTFTISQANNVFIFPGVGLGSVVAGATKVTDSMMVAAAEAVSLMALDLPAEAGVLPPVSAAPEVARQVAMAVAHAAVTAGVAPQADPDDFRTRLQDYQWSPVYPEVTAADTNGG